MIRKPEEILTELSAVNIIIENDAQLLNKYPNDFLITFNFEEAEDRKTMLTHEYKESKKYYEGG